MGNYKLVFQGTVRSGTNDFDLVCYVNMHNEIYININMDASMFGFICLDKSTAIKLAKTLRTEINKMQDEKSF